MVINDLFKQMFGCDFLTYNYSKEHGTSVSKEINIVEYNHEHWEALYNKILLDDPNVIESAIDLQQEELQSSMFCQPMVNGEAKFEVVKNAFFSITPEEIGNSSTSPSSEDLLVDGSSSNNLP